ncbi:hypothetical protein [[Mycoplasma] testudinis]|uniref:hypothetical protein n=1 Tax=[Mycoplasma] testudinis TaxID=33924 RepID=UPI000487B287|nr:hypothetical protein [[Mycoplasma] testudinis]
MAPNDPAALANSPTLTQLNAILDANSQLQPLSDNLISQGFNVIFTKGTTDNTAGTIVINVFVKDALGNNYNITGTASPGTTFTGAAHTITGFMRSSPT